MSSYLIPADFTYLPSFPFYLVTTGLNATNLPTNHYGLSLAFWSHSTEKLQEPSKTLKKSFVRLKKQMKDFPLRHKPVPWSEHLPTTTLPIQLAQTKQPGKEDEKSRANSFRETF